MFYRSVRASRREHALTLPGDELIAKPIGSLTHAITIGRPGREVWPWIVQMGAGSRAGWYSYDRLDNGGRPSAECIMPNLQDIAVGTLFPALPGAKDGFNVLQYEPETSLVLGAGSAAGGTPLVTWAFLLQRIDERRTRLITRARGGPSYRFQGLPQWTVMLIVPLVHFVMQRKQLLGIARRAESTRSTRERGARTEAA